MKTNQPADAIRAVGSPAGCAAELRRHAEEGLQTRQRTPQSAIRNPQSAQRLVHELQVHQIELEMQNEELQRARAQLCAHVAQYLDLFEFAPTGYLTLDREGVIRQANLAVAGLFGVERSRLLKRRFDLFVAEGDRRAFSDFLQRVFAGQAKECCEVTLPQAGHHPLFVRIEGTRSADGQECLAVLVDLTERKQAEEELEASKERLHLATEASAVGIWEWNVITNQIRWDAQMFRIYGIAPTEDGVVPYSVWSGAVLPEDLARQEEVLQDTVRRCGKNRREFRIRRADDGSYRHIEAVETVRTNAQRKAEWVVGTNLDITERKQAAETLRESRELYSSLVENLPQHVFRKDRAGRFTFGNGPFCQSLGKPLAEILGKIDQDVCPAPLAQKYRQDDQRVVETGQPFEGDEEHQQADGKMLYVHVNKTPLRDASGNIIGVQGISWDITEKKKLEAQFLRAQRMESVGRLAGGIAHDLNNILAPILMGTSLLREGLPLAEAGPLIDTIARSAQRGADIVKQLLTFARGTDGQKVPLPPSRLLKEMAKIVQETFPKSIACRAEFPKDLWTVAADPTQLHQVLLNLCINARDAMPAGGTLTLAAENVTLDDCYASMSPEAKAGPYVILQVSDTGTGISPAVADKIFDPFFTTKGLEMGTGLGLATVHGIVKSHDGFIQVESQVGRGSHFRVYLPALPATIAAAAATPARELPRGQGQLVLVVDDEPSVRDITRKMLEHSGYRVLTANEGTAAIALYTQRQAEIQVVLTDMMMPVMDGPATVRVLRGMNPHVKIIAASGAASKHRLAEIADLPVQAYLQKPFTSQSLLVTLDQVLRGEQTQG